MEGEFLDTVSGIPDSRTQVVMLRPPNRGTRLELSGSIQARPRAGDAGHDGQRVGTAQRGLQGRDLQAAVDRLAADGYGLVGGIGELQHSWRMAYVRGPEGMIVSLAERIG